MLRFGMQIRQGSSLITLHFVLQSDRFPSVELSGILGPPSLVFLALLPRGCGFDKRWLYALFDKLIVMLFTLSYLMSTSEGLNTEYITVKLASNI